MKFMLRFLRFCAVSRPAQVQIAEDVLDCPAFPVSPNLILVGFWLWPVLLMAYASDFGVPVLYTWL